jgi:hypothetical protein
MKKIIILFVFGLLARQVVPAQGSITYLSNIAQPSVGSLAIGSDSWLATDIFTGTNTSGYLLDSIQLEMADASGNPISFAAMLYSATGVSGLHPGSSLGALDGSLNPSTAGIYTFTPISSLILSPSTDYFIVLKAGTTVANGAYEWNLTTPNVLIGDGSWKAGGIFHSDDGSTWLYNSGALQFAIDATAVPEPGVLSLLGLGGAALLWRRQAKTAR